MADRKISDLTALTAPAAGDYLPIVDISEVSAANKNKRITIEELLRGAPDGTAAAPSIGFESDPNTGIYSPGADQLAISTNGVGRLFVDSAGNVGIGTSSPGFAVDISAPNDTIVRSRTNGNTSAGFIGSTNNGTNNWFFGSRKDSAGGTSGTDRFNLLYDVNAFLTVTTGGNVGIGTTNFGGKLTVKTSSSNGAPVAWGDGQLVVTAGDGTTSPGFGISTNTSDNSVSLSALTPGTGWNNLHLRAAQTIFYKSDAASNEVGRWDSSGRLLVGTSSGGSVARLQVQGSTLFNDAFVDICYNGSAASGIAADTSLGLLRFTDQASNANIFAQISCATDAAASSGDYPGRLVFSTTADGAASPTERLRITSAGVLQVADASNISVGTTTGTKIGTATTQKLGFYNATPVVQPTAVADATDAASVITQLNALLAKLRTLGIIAT